MERIWIISTFVLLTLLIVLAIYHFYYYKNIVYIKTQLDEMLNNEDTNQLLTVEARQENIVLLVNQLNALLTATRASQIRMKRLNRSFRQSITNISHDVRTPLTTASGYLQMLQTTTSEQERKEYLAIVLERQHMVQTLLDQLFEYVRIESGEITYEHVPIDAKKVFVDTLTMYYDDFNQKGEEPIVHLPDSPCIINGDVQGLKRIFSNILANALRHGTGGYRFEILESDSYIFVFSNKSDLLTKEDLENIFERSYTKDKSRNKKTTGLGLTIAKEITEQLGGYIDASYEKGRFEIRVSFKGQKQA